MHKLTVFLCVVIGVFLFCACGRRDESESRFWQENGRLKVVSTTAMIHDLVATIGGEQIDATVLIRGGLDPHSYELVKGDGEKFERADLIFCNGLNLEHGYSLRRYLTSSDKAVSLGDMLLQKEGAVIYAEGQCDPHIWMDISLWLEVVDPIVEALSKALPESRAQFCARGEELKKAMHKADDHAYTALQRFPQELRYLVTSHNAFNYFARRYLAAMGEEKDEAWRCRVQAPEGLSPEAQLKLSDLQALLMHIEKHKIATLFPESGMNRDTLNKIIDTAASRGLHVTLAKEALLSDAMGHMPSYLHMMEYNVQAICSQWGE